MYFYSIIALQLKTKSLENQCFQGFWDLFGGPERIRTAVQGFADLCLTARPQDHSSFKSAANLTQFFLTIQLIRFLL